VPGIGKPCFPPSRCFRHFPSRCNYQERVGRQKLRAEERRREGESFYFCPARTRRLRLIRAADPKCGCARGIPFLIAGKRGSLSIAEKRPDAATGTDDVNARIRRGRDLYCARHSSGIIRSEKASLPRRDFPSMLSARRSVRLQNRE